MLSLPVYVSIVFGATTLLTVYFLFWAVNHSGLSQRERKAKWVLLISVFWLAAQASISLNGIYSDNLDQIPPWLFVLGVGPLVLLMIISFATKAGRNFIDGLPLEKLGWIHTVRVPVELVLYWAFYGAAVPKIMTFEGWNFDILAGLSAPLIMYYGFFLKKLSRNILLAWNFVCLGLVLFIITIAILSAPFPLQQLAFDQPNVLVLHYPFTWLPSFVAPMVVFVHLISIRQLLKSKNL